MKKDRTLSYSSLKEFDKSPNHLIAYWNRDLTPSSAQIKGTLIHTLTLEPDTFDAKYAIFDGKVKRGKAYDEFVQENVGKTIISAKDFNEATIVKSAIFTNEAIHDIFMETHTTEKLIEWSKDENRFKSIIDGIGDGFIFDLKTTASADPKKFTNDAFKYGYAMQAAMYCMAASVQDFYIIAVETAAPYNATLFKMDDALIQYGVSEFNRIIEKYNNWDGKPIGYSGGVETLGLPEWFKKQKELVDIF